MIKYFTSPICRDLLVSGFVASIILISIRAQNMNLPKVMPASFRPEPRPSQLVVEAERSVGNSIDIGNGMTRSDIQRNISLFDRNHHYHWDGISGINIQQLSDAMDTIYRGKSLGLVHLRPQYEKRFGPVPAFIVYDRNLPEGQKLGTWMSTSVSLTREYLVQSPRIWPVMQIFNEALQLLLSQPFAAKSHFPALWRVLEQIGILPMLFQLDDFIGCIHENRGPNITIPIFTLSQKLGCPSALGIPSHTVISDYAVYEREQEWDNAFGRHDAEYPWNEKKRKLFWRGTCTFYRWSQPSVSVRNKVMTWASKEGAIHTDIQAIHGDHEFACNDKLVLDNWTHPETSMKYLAVLDMDGYAWSERFPRLLCYNSVVVKLDPMFGDYLHYTLIPGHHFLPADFANISDVLNYIINPANDAHLQQIVRNANQWCRHHMRRPQLMRDVLDVLNGYVELLDRDNGDWLEWWRQHYGEYIQRGKQDFFREVGLNATELRKHSKELHPSPLV